MASEIARRVRLPSPRATVAIGAAVLLLIVLYMGRSALGPFILGALLVYILDPAVGWLTRRGLRRGLAILIVYAVVIVVLIEGLTLLFGPLVRQIIDFVDDLPALLASIEGQLDNLVLLFDQLQLPRILRDAIASILESLASGGGFDIGSLAPLYSGLAAALRNLLALAIVPIWAFYLLKDRDRLLTAVRDGIPADWREDAWSVMAICERVFGRWLRGQIVLCVAVGLATFVGLMALSLVDPIFGRFAVLLAVIAGILELVPIIGPIISMVPTLLLAATTGRVEAIVAVVVLYIIVQQLENQLLVPRIQGGAVEMHPAIVILALAIGASIAGLIGAIFALPIAAAARDIVRYVFQRASGHTASESAGYRPPPGQPALAIAGASSGGQESDPAPEPGLAVETPGHDAEAPAEADAGPAGRAADAGPAGRAADAEPAGRATDAGRAGHASSDA
ncbi:MAG: AI-2E family transporter [Candidatus Limnocylindrales bacterium]